MRRAPNPPVTLMLVSALCGLAVSGAANADQATPTVSPTTATPTTDTPATVTPAAGADHRDGPGGQPREHARRGARSAGGRGQGHLPHRQDHGFPPADP
jgi:hypothetical protein